jgi:serpin B
MKRHVLGWFALLVLLVAILSSMACRKPAGEEDKPDSNPPALRPGVSREEKPPNADKASKADIQALARGNNQFAIDLFRGLGATHNLFISPVSVSLAVSMTFCANEGVTATQLARSLHVPFSGERLHTAFAGLYWKLLGEGKPRAHELSIANALWVTTRKDFRANEDFLNKVRDNYASAPCYVDFHTQGAKPINAWCAEKTRGKIKRILGRGDVHEGTVSVLANAIYFRGEWWFRFQKDWTTPGPFHTASGETVEVPIMYQLAEVPYHEDRGGEDRPGVQVLEMPYKGDDLSMIVVLPRKRGGLAAVEASLTAERLEGWVKNLAKRKVRMMLPRFKLAGERLHLKDTLEKLGMPVAASPNVGTLQNGLMPEVFEVYHKTVVEVNEEGAEAAGVTVEKVKDKEEKGSDGSVLFRADQPFLFLIRDRDTGCILFLGRLQEPK